MAPVRTAMAISFVLALLLAVPVSVGETADYRVSIEKSVDVPDRTIETEWGEKEVSEVGKHRSGEYLSVATRAPSGERYTIRIVDSEQRLMDSQSGTGDDEGYFHLDRYDPGTYAVAMMNGTDEVLAVQPLVVAGYAVDQRAPDTAEADGEVTVEAELTAVSDDVSSPPESVEVVVGNDTSAVEVDATRQSGLTYAATVDVGSLSTGEYRVYTAVRRDNEVFGERELVALSDAQRLSVVDEEPSSTATSEPSGPSEPSTSTEAATESSTEDEPTATADTTTEPTGTAEPSTESEPATSSLSATRTTTARPTGTVSETTRPPAATTDAGRTGTSAADTDAETAAETPLLPDLGRFVSLVALALVARTAARRRRN